VHQSDDQHLKRSRWHAPTDLAELTQRSETPRYRSLNMYPHREISVDVNAQITDKQRWDDRNASDQVLQK